MTFFGGEPLLNMPVLYYLSERMHASCAARGVQLLAEYSLSFDVLGAVVEKITGKTLGGHLADTVWKPLKMTDTTFRLTDAQRAYLLRHGELAGSWGVHVRGDEKLRQLAKLARRLPRRGLRITRAGRQPALAPRRGPCPARPRRRAASAGTTAGRCRRRPGLRWTIIAPTSARSATKPGCD